MISYKRDVVERQSLSEVKMGRGSPICERVRKKIVEYYKNNVPQRQIAKALQISSSTVHNIIKKMSQHFLNLGRNFFFFFFSFMEFHIYVIVNCYLTNNDCARLAGIGKQLGMQAGLNGSEEAPHNCRCNTNLIKIKMQSYQISQHVFAILWCSYS